MVFRGSLGLLPIIGGVAILLIAIQTYKVKQMGKQFAECVVHKGIVEEMGMREPTKLRPYRHCVVVCRFASGNDVVEIPYESGDLKDTQVGDEIPLYFYENGATTVVAYDNDTVKKKLRQQVIVILVLCIVLSLFIPVVGQFMKSRT